MRRLRLLIVLPLLWMPACGDSDGTPALTPSTTTTTTDQQMIDLQKEVVRLNEEIVRQADDQSARLRYLESEVARLRASRSARTSPVSPNPTIPFTGPGACGGCGDLASILACIRSYEGSYTSVSPSGTYRGAYQFNQTTWNGAVTRAGYPEWSGRHANDAPPAVQDAAAAQLYSERGLQPWPTPSKYCG